MTARRFYLSCLLSALTACGGLLPEEQTDAGSDTKDACTDLVNGGQEIPETAGFVSFGAMGGTVPDGTYHLTKFEIFSPGSVDPYVRRHALRVTGNKIEVVTQRDGGAEERSSGTFATNDSNVTFTVDCPEAATHSFEYTASETQFIHIIKGEGIHEVHTYTKQ